MNRRQFLRNLSLAPVALVAVCCGDIRRPVRLDSPQIVGVLEEFAPLVAVPGGIWYENGALTIEGDITLRGAGAKVLLHNTPAGQD